MCACRMPGPLMIWVRLGRQRRVPGEKVARGSAVSIVFTSCLVRACTGIGPASQGFGTRIPGLCTGHNYMCFPIDIYTKVCNIWCLVWPEIVDFSCLGGPGGPTNHYRRGRGPCNLWNGFWPPGPHTPQQIEDARPGQKPCIKHLYQFYMYTICRAPPMPQTPHTSVYCKEGADETLW
jgi:hypothetical protein